MNFCWKRCFELVFPCFVIACGGGSTNSTPPSDVNVVATPFRAYVVDDYVIGGTVKFLDVQTGNLIGQTKTGAKGEVAFDLPTQGSYSIVVTGGVIDADGDPATVEDQTPFNDTIRGMALPEFQSKTQILGSATTGIVNFSGVDSAKYRDAVQLLDKVIPMFTSPASADLQLRTVVSVQRSVGFSKLVEEVSDDGRINGSINTGESGVSVIAAAMQRASVLSVKDPQLFTCIEEAIGKQNPLVADLQKVTELVCANRYIYTLDGIESLSNLTSLVLRGNAISSIKPLAAIPTLTYVDLASNRISSLSGLVSAKYLDAVTINVDDNCIASGIVASNVELLYESRQRTTCNKVVRDPVLFNARRLALEKFLVSYRIPTASSCALQYSSTISTPLICDGKIHLLEVVVPWSKANEYVRLNIDNRSYGVYTITNRMVAPTCTINQTLVNYQCVPKTCPAGQNLVNGQCVTPKPVCTAPQVLQNNVCLTPVGRYATVGSFPITDCVKDTTTGLIWEGKPTSGFRASENTYTNFDMIWTGSGFVNPTPAQASAATNSVGYALAVNATSLCGFTNWRMPTLKELYGLIPFYDAAWFPNTQNVYWTSTDLQGMNGPMIVDFVNRGVGYGFFTQATPFYVRLVR